jgi:uncharacterized protein (UPF0335 family)
MTNNKVASYAERIERLLDERATIDADIKDIYTEVKSADLKPKVLRKAIANKRRKVDKQFEEDVEEYAALLLALPGATYRGVAEKTGIPKSTLQRRVPKASNGTSPPHDPETGEILGRDAALYVSDGETIGAIAAATPQAESAPHATAAPVPDDRVGAGTPSVEQGDRQSPLRDGGAPVETSTVGPAVTTSRIANQIAAVTPLPDDPLDFPPGLDRRHERVRG